MDTQQVDENIMKIEHNIRVFQDMYLSVLSDDFNSLRKSELENLRKELSELKHKQSEIKAKCEHKWKYKIIGHGNKWWHDCVKCGESDWFSYDMETGQNF